MATTVSDRPQTLSPAAAGAAPPSATHEPPRGRPAIKDILQAFGVIYGPPAVLDLLALASVGVLTRAALRKLRGEVESSRAARLATPLAGLAVAATGAYLAVGRPWLRSWGSTREECARPLPGDEDVPDAAISSTWSVTINAPASEVWPWLAQIGQDRGGFYSYAWLENLAGCQLHNADEIHPEWQQREVGEWVPLHPDASLPLSVWEPGRALVLQGWGSFVVEPIDEHTTRLLSRSRVRRGRQAALYTLFLEIPHFVMQRKMLLGIKERAERKLE